MKPGDQVMTPAGPGEVVTLKTRYVWTGLYRQAQGFVAVHTVLTSTPAEFYEELEREPRRWAPLRLCANGCGKRLHSPGRPNPGRAFCGVGCRNEWYRKRRRP